MTNATTTELAMHEQSGDKNVRVSKRACKVGLDMDGCEETTVKRSNVAAKGVGATRFQVLR